MFGDSRASFTDSNAIFSSNSNPKGEDMLTKSRMNFDMNNNSNIQDYKQYQNNQTNSGLLRFRSAPSSLFANFDNGDVDKSGNSNEDLTVESFKGLNDSKSLSNGFAVNSQLPLHYPRHSSSLGMGTQVGAVDNSSTYRMGSSMGMENQAKMVSNLMRQNSSPAGLFSHLNSQTGYAAIRGGVGNYRLGNGSNGDLSPTASRLKSQMSFLSGLPSSLGRLSRISEIEGENIGATGNDDAKSGSGSGDTQFYTSEFPLSSWSDSLQFAENFTGLKRELDDDEKLFSGAQNNDLANRPPILSHHLSLPKTSSGDMAAMDKLLQFQDSVPCKIRAKRGCATHPRSIAERVRRTRISERMRKLQDLVPHMDKQTNTADMLDLAVEYIKDLQKQFKTLSDNRANCKCSSMQKPVLN